MSSLEWLEEMGNPVIQNQSWENGGWRKKKEEESTEVQHIIVIGEVFPKVDTTLAKVGEWEELGNRNSLTVDRKENSEKHHKNTTMEARHSSLKMAFTWDKDFCLIGSCSNAT